MTETRSDDPEDSVLVRCFLRDGDEASFLQLYRRHTPALYRFALRMLDGVEDDALDAVQEGWVRAIEALSDFRWRSALRTWLIGIVRNRCRERYRERRRRARPDDALGPETASPVRRPIARLDLEEAIAGLPAGYREVLLLHDVEQLTHREIADLLDIRPGTSKSQLSRARSAVRVALQRDAASARENTPGRSVSQEENP